MTTGGVQNNPVKVPVSSKGVGGEDAPKTLKMGNEYTFLPLSDLTPETRKRLEKKIDFVHGRALSYENNAESAKMRDIDLSTEKGLKQVRDRYGLTVKAVQGPDGKIVGVVVGSQEEAVVRGKKGVIKADYTSHTAFIGTGGGLYKSNLEQSGTMNFTNVGTLGKGLRVGLFNQQLHNGSTLDVDVQDKARMKKFEPMHLIQFRTEQ